MRIRFFFIGIYHLNFVHSSQIDPTVTAFRNIYLKFQIEIFKSLLGPQVTIADMRCTFRLYRIVDQRSIHDFPAIGLFRIGKCPTGKVFPVE